MRSNAVEDGIMAILVLDGMLQPTGCLQGIELGLDYDALLGLAQTAAETKHGISAQARQLRSSRRVTLKDPDAIERMLILMGAPRSAREWTGKRSDRRRGRL